MIGYFAWNQSTSERVAIPPLECLAELKSSAKNSKRRIDWPIVAAVKRLAIVVEAQAWPF